MRYVSLRGMHMVVVRGLKMNLPPVIGDIEPIRASQASLRHVLLWSDPSAADLHTAVLNSHPCCPGFTSLAKLLV